MRKKGVENLTYLSHKKQEKTKKYLLNGPVPINSKARTKDGKNQTLLRTKVIDLFFMIYQSLFETRKFFRFLYGYN